MKFGRGISFTDLRRSMGLTEEDLKPCCQNGQPPQIEPIGNKNKPPRDPDEIDPTRTAAAKKLACLGRINKPTTREGYQKERLQQERRK